MTETPERIGLVSNKVGGWRLWNRSDGDEPEDVDAEYVRADDLAAAQARIAVLEAAIEQLHGPLSVAALVSKAETARAEAWDEFEALIVGWDERGDAARDRAVTENILDAIRALREKQNG